MGAPLSISSKSVVCANQHKHKSIEDAMECNRYTSRRLQEDDQIHNVDQMFLNGQDRRYNPYPPRNQNRYPDEGRHSRAGQGNYNEEYRGTDPRRYDDRNEHGRNNRTCGSQYNGYNDRHQDNNNKNKGSTKADKQQQTDKEEEHFWTGWFKKNYQCAEHHNHPTIEELNECNRKREERAKERHRQAMEEKFQRGGIKRHIDGSDEHREGPVIEEVD